VNHKTNVSTPQHRSNQLKDKVVPNNSQVKLKKIQVEVHPRIPSVSNKMNSVTACKDGLNSRTLNANAVCVTCNKCLVDSNHFACVTKMLNDVNARTKKPNVVPISTRKPKSHANKPVATPQKEKVASKPTNQKPHSYFRMLYEKTTWLWHQRLSYLNFDYINLLSKKGVVIALPKLKYVKDQLCSSCELSKVKRTSFKSKAVPNSKGRLNLLHMDLCGLMRVASINGKKHILVIVDDYSRYTWTLFLRSKDETPEVLEEFLTMIQRNLQASVITVRTDRGTEVYYVKGLKHNLFSVGQFCDADLEVDFWKSTRFVSDLQGNDLLTDADHVRCIDSRKSTSGGIQFLGDKKALYGLKQAPRAWYDELSKFLTSKVFTKGTLPSTNIHPTSKPSTPTYVHAEENNDNQAEDAQAQQDEFINPFCTPVREVTESSLRNIDNSNLHTFNQPQDSENRWTNDHPIEQVYENPSNPVQTRRQLATDPEMCMFALTVSIAELKNIKEAMADSAWIEAMQEVLHQFDRLQVWELVDKPFGKTVIRLKWLCKNKKDEDQTIIRNKARLVAKGYA
nr:retrovirus-related Pol polyprotein from transposon TNT 1-94 [Tanacetum cinerariifolium]